MNFDSNPSHPAFHRLKERSVHCRFHARKQKVPKRQLRLLSKGLDIMMQPERTIENNENPVRTMLCYDQTSS
jgi:hypothetical protein